MPTFYTLPIKAVQRILKSLLFKMTALKLLQFSLRKQRNITVSKNWNDPFEKLEAIKVKHMRHLPPM